MGIWVKFQKVAINTKYVLLHSGLVIETWTEKGTASIHDITLVNSNWIKEIQVAEMLPEEIVISLIQTTDKIETQPLSSQKYKLGVDKN